MNNITPRDVARISQFNSALAELRGAYGRKGMVGGSSKTPTADVTQSPQFKKWFGKSKVVDAGGNPLVMYRGTQNKNAEPYGGSGFIFLSNSKDFAKIYAGENDVYSLYVKCEYPFDASYGEGRDLFERFIKETNQMSFAQSGSSMGTLPFWTIQPQLVKWLDDNKIKYDGIYFAENNHKTFSLAVKNISQIKSIANDGSFDPDNPNIMLSR